MIFTKGNLFRSLHRKTSKNKERVKQEEEMRAEKLRQMEEIKKQENQIYYKDRIEKERLRIQAKEKKIQKMEKLEADLLNRLKNSQQLEQTEYNKLEQVLKESNKACEERKKNQTMIRKPRPKEIVKAKSSMSTHESNKSNQNGYNETPKTLE